MNSLTDAPCFADFTSKFLRAGGQHQAWVWPGSLSSPVERAQDRHGSELLLGHTAAECSAGASAIASSSNLVATQGALYLPFHLLVMLWNAAALQ